MSDGPYRYAKSYRGQWHVENDSGAFLWFDREEDAKETCHHMNVAWRLARRAASEKARRVVEAARAALKDMDDNGDSIVSDPDKDRLRQALADYDRA